MLPQATIEACDAVVGFVFFHNYTEKYVQVSTKRMAAQLPLFLVLTYTCFLLTQLEINISLD